MDLYQQMLVAAQMQQVEGLGQLGAQQGFVHSKPNPMNKVVPTPEQKTDETLLLLEEE